MAESYSGQEVSRCIHMGLLCAQEDPEDRPTMATVVLMLNSYSVTLPLPREPAFFRRTRTDMGTEEFLKYEQSTTSGSAQKFSSINEASITELYPR